MNTPPIVSPEAWEAARLEILGKEKAFTRASLLDGMVPMYLLMSAFHSPQWLNLSPADLPQKQPMAKAGP